VEVSKSRTLTFKERVQIFNKRTKRNSTKHSLILLVILSFMLFGGRFINFNYIENVKLASSAASGSNNSSKLNCIFVGDIMFGRSIEKVIDKKGYDFLFQNVNPLLKNADYVCGNFENAIILKDEKEYETAKKNILLYAKNDSVKILKNNNFTVLNLANNHVLDYGVNGLKDTINTFKDNNLAVVGAGNTRKEAEAYNIKEINGIKVATLGFSEVVAPGFNSAKDKGGILDCKPENFLKLIQEANKKVDLVIVNCHWGEEYETKQCTKQEVFARAMVDAGADIVIGHHPHVLEPVEVYKDSLICYSLGNFIFDQGWSRTRDSTLVNYKLNETGVGEFNILPVRIEGGKPSITNSKYYSKRILKELTLNLKPEQFVIKDNKLVIKLDNSRIFKSKKDNTNGRNNTKNEKIR